jgi:hypothetical protein
MHHPFMVELLKHHGVNVGFHHYDRKGATKMVEEIGKEMHKILINHLLNTQYPCSLIVDGSTSVGLIHYVTVLIQTLEKERPVVYFYKLIEMGLDSTAQGLMDSLEESFKKEHKDIIGFFKNNLVGLGADGASVNFGNKGGFIVKLRQFTGNDIYAVWCMPHRMELAVKEAVKNHEVIAKIDEGITALTAYYTRSYKRKARLRQLAFTENIGLYELHFAFRQRWIFSDYSAVKAVVRGWKIFVQDLQSIQGKKGFETEWATAKTIEDLITTRSFVYGLYFLYDLLDGLKRFSKIAQTSAGILIGKEGFRKELVGLAQQFKNKNGRHLTSLLEAAPCQDDGKCTATPGYFLTHTN